MRPKIKKLSAREILSSGSSPTLEVTCELESGARGTSSVAFGVSAGIHEAFLLLDNDKKRYNGKGMLRAAKNVKTFIHKILLGKNSLEQKDIDELLIHLDGTQNKSRLGANAILGASLAVARAASQELRIPLFSHLQKAFGLAHPKKLPEPMMVVIEGGKHADNSTDIQEYLICPTGNKPLKEKIRCGIEVYFELKRVLQKKKYNTNVGNEGAFAPNNIQSNELPFQLIREAIQKAGYGVNKDVQIAIDAAASEFFVKNMYSLQSEKKILNAKKISHMYQQWIEKYSLFSIEDPFAQDEWESWSKFKEDVGDKALVIGDDLTVTHRGRLMKALAHKCISGVIIKPNQAGTLSETMDSCILAKKYHAAVIVSHRGGGETNDTFISDLAYAVGADYIKVGPSRGERVEKYNRLMEIEDVWK